MTLLFVLLGLVVLAVVIGFFSKKTKNDAKQVVEDVKDLGKDVVILVKDEVKSSSPVSGSLNAPVSGSAISGSK